MPEIRDADVGGQEKTASLSSDSHPISPQDIPPHVNESKLMRKIDFHVLPILFAIYVAAFIDRYVLSHD
jgi:hypothetical protein